MNEASMVRCNLKNARLELTSFFQASLEQITATKADFSGADLSESHCMMADFTDAVLIDARFDYANLEATIFQGADLTNVSFQGALMLDTDFSNSNWWRTVGMEPAILEDLKDRFAPDTDAPQRLRDDYQQWLSEE